MKFVFFFFKSALAGNFTFIHFGYCKIPMSWSIIAASRQRRETTNENNGDNEIRNFYGGDAVRVVRRERRLGGLVLLERHGGAARRCVPDLRNRQRQGGGRGVDRRQVGRQGDGGRRRKVEDRASGHAGEQDALRDEGQVRRRRRHHARQRGRGRHLGLLRTVQHGIRLHARVRHAAVAGRARLG